MFRVPAGARWLACRRPLRFRGRPVELRPGPRGAGFGPEQGCFAPVEPVPGGRQPGARALDGLLRTPVPVRDEHDKITDQLIKALLARIGQPVALVSVLLARIGQPVALVSVLLARIGQPVTFVGVLLALVSFPLARIGQPVALVSLLPAPVRSGGTCPQ